MRASSRRRRAPATRCSISPATSPARAAARRRRAVRGPRPLHLCRSRALLQLPPLDPARRAGLRPAYQRHRARRLTTLPQPALSAGWTYAVVPAARLCLGREGSQQNKRPQGSCDACGVASAARMRAAAFGRVRRRRRAVGCSSPRCALAGCTRPDQRRARRRRSRAAPPSPSNRSTARRTDVSSTLVQDLNDEAQIAPARRAVARAALGLSRARLSRRRRSSSGTPRSPGSGTSSTTTSSRALAHHRRGDRQGPASATPGTPPTTPCCSRIARTQHGAARRLPDLADVAPGTPAAEPRLALTGDDVSPEAAGIFRISQPNADPAPAAQPKPAAARRAAAAAAARRSRPSASR